MVHFLPNWGSFLTCKCLETQPLRVVCEADIADIVTTRFNFALVYAQEKPRFPDERIRAPRPPRGHWSMQGQGGMSRGESQSWQSPETDICNASRDFACVWQIAPLGCWAFADARESWDDLQLCVDCSQGSVIGGCVLLVLAFLLLLLATVSVCCMSRLQFRRLQRWAGTAGILCSYSTTMALVFKLKLQWPSFLTKSQQWIDLRSSQSTRSHSRCLSGPTPLPHPCCLCHTQPHPAQDPPHPPHPTSQLLQHPLQSQLLVRGFTAALFEGDLFLFQQPYHQCSVCSAATFGNRRPADRRVLCVGLCNA